METVKIGVMIRDRDFRNALLRGLSHESRDFQFIDICGTRSDPESFGSSGVTSDPSGCQIILLDHGCSLEGPYTDMKGPYVDMKEPYDDMKGPYVGGKAVEMYGQAADSRVEREGREDAAVIHLTYHELYDLSFSQDRMEIFRYEDSRIFISKIIYYYARKKGIDLYFHGKRKCRKVVFSSLSGGCGTTSAAVTSARFLKYRFSKKTLFVSLCPLDGSRKFTGAGDGGNMLSLLYHLNVGDSVPLCKFISSSEGVDHFRGLASNRAAAEMTGTELKRLIRMIDEMGEYDFVIFDVGNHIGSLAKMLIDGADVSVIVRQKNDQDDDLFFSGKENGENGQTGKVIRVTDFDDEGAGGEGSVSLTYDPDAFVRREKRTYIDMRGRYGRDVSRLAERIMGCADE